jgi:hypothetical protein
MTIEKLRLAGGNLNWSYQILAADPVRRYRAVTMSAHPLELRIPLPR